MRRPVHLTRRSFTALTAGAAAAGVLGRAGAWAQGQPVVVELFTSQGCSASPPADALLAEISRQPGVIALTFNVDYWDYLGWRDTLGSPDSTKRQRDYAERRGDGHVYTPQAVINGRQQMLGSDREGLLAGIARESGREGGVSVTLSRSDNEVLVEVAEAPTKRLRRDATVWVVTVAPRVVVTIDRGENAGRTVTYTNAVQKIVPAGVWHGARTGLSLPRPAIVPEGTFCVALLQADGTGPILGASVPRSSVSMSG